MTTHVLILHRGDGSTVEACSPAAALVMPDAESARALEDGLGTILDNSEFGSQEYMMWISHLEVEDYVGQTAEEIMKKALEW